MMSIPEGTLVVIDSMLISAAVAPYVHKVVGETDKTVSLVALDAVGEVINSDNIKLIRKTSIVAIIGSLTEFQPYREMNEKISNLYTAYSDAFRSGEQKVNVVKREFQAKLKGSRV